VAARADHSLRLAAKPTSITNKRSAILERGELRMGRFRFVIWLTLALAAAVARGQNPGGEPPLRAEAGRYALKIPSGGFDRVAHIHVPAGYQAGSKPPLVLALHGAGGNGTGILDHDGWAAKADGEGFIVVAPDGLPAKPKNSANFFTNPMVWNAGQLKAGSQRGAIDDVAFIRQLLDTLASRIAYDKSHVFCTGHSNGGAMTFRLAAEISERFAAIGSVAGLMALDNPRPARPMPTLYILGTKDPLMPLNGGEVKLPWGTRMNPPVAQPLAAWAKALGCDTTPRTISEAGEVKKVEYRSKNGGPMLVVIYLEGHGHQWPGGERTLPASLVGPITSKFDATDALWSFFQTQTAAGSGAKSAPAAK
jgi:polyhydroxybutyrate depolymerase